MVYMTSESFCPELPSPGHEMTASSSDFESLLEIGLFWLIFSMCSLGFMEYPLLNLSSDVQ